MKRRGFALAELMMIIAMVAILAAFIVPSLMQPRMSANEEAAAGSLRSLLSAQKIYFNRYECYGSLPALRSEGLIDEELAAGRKDGYWFGEIATDPRVAFCFAAAPVEDGKLAEKEYCATQKGEIYEGSFDTSKINPPGFVWVPGQNSVPELFTATPECDEQTWSRSR